MMCWNSAMLIRLASWKSNEELLLSKLTFYVPLLDGWSVGPSHFQRSYQSTYFLLEKAMIIGQGLLNTPYMHAQCGSFSICLTLFNPMFSHSIMSICSLWSLNIVQRMQNLCWLEKLFIRVKLWALKGQGVQNQPDPGAQLAICKKGGDGDHWSGRSCGGGRGPPDFFF